MPACRVCQSKDITFKCKTCGNEFCFKHTGSTDVSSCKNHPQFQYKRLQAEERGRKCRIALRSRCPLCSKLLEIRSMPNGQMYLACTNCKWNSRVNTPIIMANTEKALLKEGEKYYLTGNDLCNEKFRLIRGKDFCSHCFVSQLEKTTENSFDTLETQFGLSIIEITSILKELLEHDTIKGILDEQNKSFITLSTTDEEKIVADLQTKGMIDLSELEQKFSIKTQTAFRIIIELIRRHQLRGAFNQKKNRYYLEAGLSQLILQEISSKGQIIHNDLAKKFDILEGNIKNYITNLMKNKLVNAYFIDNGNGTISVEALESEIETYCTKNGIFMITALANHLKITQELARKTLFGLIQKGTVRGIFTQNHEFITEETLTEKIKTFARAYGTISFSELAKKLAITEQRVEEGLVTLIARGSIAGKIDSTQRVFVADKNQPITKFGGFVHDPNATPGSGQMQVPLTPRGDIEVVRQYDFVGGQLHFKVVVKNKSNMAIHDIKVILDVPSSYRRARELITIPVIDPGNTHGVDFYLEPAECGISTIGGTVLYKDALGNSNSIYIEKKDVQIKCPLVIKTLDTIEDCQKAIQSLPSDARAFLIADLPAQMAYSAAYRAISQFDTRNVASYEDDKSGAYEAEAWFSSEAKVTGGRVITRVYYNGSTSTLEVRVWCNDAGQLTGFLAKIIELLFVEINMMRRVKAEERSKTLDVMAISRAIIEVEDICMLRYKASSAKLKLEDIHTRLTRVTCNCDDISQKIYDWVKKLESYGEDTNINDDDADKLEKDMQGIHQALQAQLGA